MSAAIFWAMVGAVAGAYATLGILAIGDRVNERRERIKREKAIAEAEAKAKREAMVRAIRAMTSANGDHLGALAELQEREDHEAAALVYVLFKAESDFTGNTWAAVEEAA